jgi:hypothetical protein
VAVTGLPAPSSRSPTSTPTSTTPSACRDPGEIVVTGDGPGPALAVTTLLTG